MEDDRDRVLGVTCIDLNPETKDVTNFNAHFAPLAEEEPSSASHNPSALALVDEDEGREGPWEVVYNWKVFPRLNKLSEVPSLFDKRNWW